LSSQSAVLYRRNPQIRFTFKTNKITIRVKAGLKEVPCIESGEHGRDYEAENSDWIMDCTGLTGLLSGWIAAEPNQAVHPNTD
jgi:hypothetical protein